MKGKIPETKWEYSLETEARRVLHSAHQITVGFYELNNFLVLPFGSYAKADNIVLFPNINFQTIPRFWDRVKTINISHFPIQAPVNLLQEVEELLKSANLPKPSFKAAESLWGKFEKQIIESIYNVLSNEFGKIKKITVYPTVLGTKVSFNLPSQFPAEVFIYLREDQGILAITEGLLTSITRQDVFSKLEGLWQESELLVDWLTNFSSISDTLRKIEPKKVLMPTIKSIRVKQEKKLERLSSDFLKNLGASPLHKKFEVKNGDIIVEDKTLRNLTQREHHILSTLVKSHGETVSFDSLGDLIFKE